MSAADRLEIRRRFNLNRRVIHRTNDAGTCLWCGDKLRPIRYDALKPNRGDYGDNAFCGLRCGYSFAVAVARNGQRLAPYDETAES